MIWNFARYGAWRDAEWSLSKLRKHVHVEAAGSMLSRAVIVSRMKTVNPRSRLTITPLLDNALQDAGVDLRLGADFIVFRHSSTSVFDTVALKESSGHSQDPRRIQENVTKAWGRPFILHPGELVLAATLEYVVLPFDVAAQVVTRSSYGRLGLITATAVQVQPGSRSCITLELLNQGPTPITLMPGTRIAQLVLSHVPAAEQPTPGKYWRPTSSTPSPPCKPAGSGSGR
jgi:deoxycytidine triphosphate deaminase